MRAAIRMINRMCNLNLTKDEMIAVGKEVGADVPFCILNRPAFVEGIGEKITTFSCKPDFSLLLINHVKVYRQQKPSISWMNKKEFILIWLLVFL